MAICLRQYPIVQGISRVPWYLLSTEPFSRPLASRPQYPSPPSRVIFLQMKLGLPVTLWECTSATITTRSSRIRVPFLLSVVDFSREALPPKRGEKGHYWGT